MQQIRRFTTTGLASLPAGFVALDASRPWICYWILHSLALLDRPLCASDIPCPDTVAEFLGACQHPDGMRTAFHPPASTCDAKSQVDLEAAPNSFHTSQRPMQQWQRSSPSAHPRPLQPSTVPHCRRFCAAGALPQIKVAA